MRTHIILLCCLCYWFSFTQSITEAEYFFNTDPGFGNATALTVNANSGNLTQSFSIPTPLNVTGFNTLYIRALDNLNIWSLYESRLLYITDSSIGQSATEITAIEYFINTDPGFGNATTLNINTNTGILSESYAIPIGTYLNGFNTLFIRTLDDLGNWSLYDSANFYVSEVQGTGATELTSIEYFIDNDPGFGSANPVSVMTNTGNTSQNIIIPLGNLIEGFHNLYIRVQDDLGQWSLYDKRLFFVTPELTVSPIVSAEYFYDTDPGFGNGTSVNISPTGNTNEFIIDLSTADISCDFHDFYIRLVNSDGSWSLYDYGLQIEVFDNANPTIVVFNDIIVELDANGQGNLTLVDVDNGTFDDCELVSVALNQPQFDYDCNDLGMQTVTITAIDAENKVSNQDVPINIVDRINPVAISQNIQVQLDANGQASITASQIDNGSTDNCSIVSRTLDVSSFSCNDLGSNTVRLTVEDQSGNTNFADAIVTVVDQVNPTVSAQNIQVQLDANGQASITAAQIDNGSTDNCSIVSRTLDVSSFSCNDLGTNTVRLTVNDQSGNTNFADATVTVVDLINPTVSSQNIQVQLDANGQASITAAQIDNGSTDNCSIVSRTLDISSFSCNDLGSNTVRLTVEDQSGNTNFADATVTVVDQVNPTVSAQNIQVQLDANGQASITAAQIDNGSTDNCSIVSRTLDVSSFSCNDLGTNTVRLTVDDQSGNTNFADATVTVVDTINPTAIGQDITVDLNGNSSVSINANDVNNGSNDNCAISNLLIDQDTFTMPGDYLVNLTVFDSSNNESTIIVTVTVIDSTFSTDDFNTLDFEVIVHPIPTSDIIFVESEVAISEILIIDINGKLVTKTSGRSGQLDISSLSKGIYFLKMKGENSSTIIKRIIKK